MRESTGLTNIVFLQLPQCVALRRNITKLLQQTTLYTIAAVLQIYRRLWKIACRVSRKAAPRGASDLRTVRAYQKLSSPIRTGRTYNGNAQSPPWSLSGRVIASRAQSA